MDADTAAADLIAARGRWRALGMALYWMLTAETWGEAEDAAAVGWAIVSPP